MFKRESENNNLHTKGAVSFQGGKTIFPGSTKAAIEINKVRKV